MCNRNTQWYESGMTRPIPFLVSAALLACSDEDDDSASESDADTDTDTDSDTDTDTDTDTALEEARDLWDAAAIDEYEFILQWHCFCPKEMAGPALLAVEDDTVVSATYVSGGAVDPAFRTETIDTLFDVLSAAYAKGASSVTAKYDAKLGYPTLAFIDYDAKADDDELGFEVSSFTTKP